MKYQKYEYIVATYPLHHLTDKKDNYIYSETMIKLSSPLI